MEHYELNIRHGKNCIEIEIQTIGSIENVKPFQYEQRIEYIIYTYKFQIIKRKYSDIREILLGFDLDSSCVALTKLNNDINPNIYVTDRYLISITYGINLINPFRQSESYNYRLIKYIRKGFVPFLPGKLHLTSEKLLKIPWSLEYCR